MRKQTSVESKKTTNRAPPVAIEYANSQWSAQLPKGHPAKKVEKNEVTERLFPNRTSTHVTIMVMSEKPLTTYIYIENYIYIMLDGTVFTTQENKRP